MIAAVLTFQQFLLQLYATSWQVALLFALLGLMVALLLGQYLLQQDSVKASHWSALSSLVVTILGMGIVVCILTMPLPFA